MKNVLFVCSANTNRSPTFERYIKKIYPKLNIKSAGIYFGYPLILSEDLLIWSDKVYVMDLSHSLFIYKRFPKYHVKVEVIGVSDQYNPDSQDLLEIIDFWLKDKNEFK